MQPAEPALALDEPTTSFKTLRAKTWPAARWALSSAQLLEAERRQK